MLRLLTVILFLFCSSARGASAPASEASIRELLRLTDARKLLEGMSAQLDGVMKNSMSQALGRSLTADEQRVADSLNAKMVAMIHDELSWEKLEPLYFDIYKKSFTQEEMDGIIAFYKSPAGAALIKKLPVVMQEAMSAMQRRMGPMMQKIQAAVEETAAEIKAGREKKP